MKALMVCAEVLLGLLILLMTLVCILVAAFVSLFELPKYWRRTHK